jgi:hypothetical protein
LWYKVLYMQSEHPPLETIQDIKRMMERSSRFISLSGWSGVSAGVCAIIGAWAGHQRISQYIHGYKGVIDYEHRDHAITNGSLDLMFDLAIIAVVTFLAAFVSSFLFTYIRSRKQGVPIWGRTVQRLAWNTILPMAVGGLFILRAITWGYFELVAPGCLIFYGLALVNASKYTLGEIRYLGYGQLVLGILNLWFVGAGLYFWAIGFGILHIIYGTMMWWKYERKAS